MSREPIALQPPLPFVFEDSVAGFVTAIDEQNLFVDRRPGASVGTMSIQLSAKQSFQLQIDEVNDEQAANSVWAARVSEQKSHHELLSIIRKKQHIDICAHQDVESSDRYTGFSRLEFMPRAMNDLGVGRLSLNAHFMGHEFSLPLLITGMTGGLEQGAMINRRLAKAAVKLGIPMGVGSQRVALEAPEHTKVFDVKKDVPEVFLIGNLGCGQIVSATSDDEALDMCIRAVEMISADAMAIHLNLLQEMIQFEGDREFNLLTQRIGHIARNLDKPLMVKEVGAGLDPESAQQLVDSGVKVLDVGGRGGTSWGYIEGLRSNLQHIRKAAATFRDFGLPTAHALRLLVEKQWANVEVVATGGLRSGLDVAKAIGSGATMCGIGLPLFRAALEDDDGPIRVLEGYRKELETTMLITGSQDLRALRTAIRTTAEFEKELDSWRTLKTK